MTLKQGAKLLQGLGALARVIEVDALVARIKKLENTAGYSGDP